MYVPFLVLRLLPFSFGPRNSNCVWAPRGSNR